MSVQSEILKSQTAVSIFDAIKDLPIIDYHCHLSPSEIYEDAEFSGISQMFLSADHYKWRLMRAYGIDEKYITGNAPDGEKFAAYIAAVEGAYGNPLRDFTRLELSKYFGIDPPLKSENSKKIRKAADEESIRELTTEREKIDRIEEIRKAADAVIREKSLSPRKLIASSNVEYIATTDDPADPLFYHEKIKEIENFSTKVVPTFRADRLFNIKAADFAAYLERFSGICGLSIASFEAFLYAIDKRIADFKAAGCSFADIGIEDFPSAEFVTREKNTEKTAEKAYKFVENCADKCLKNLEKTDKFDQKTAEKCLKNAEKTAEFEQKTAEKCLKNAEKPCKFDQKNAEKTDNFDQKNADKCVKNTEKTDKFQSGEGFELAKKVFLKAKNGENKCEKIIDKTEYYEYLGFMFPFLLSKCREHGLIVQLHLGVLRNTNAAAFSLFGADGGFDTVAESVSIGGLRAVLNAANSAGGLPKIILYTLNPSYYYPLITLSGSFRGVSVGAPWWFNDHKNGMMNYFSRMSELSHIGKIPGMLTDSRSFLSYARHDYFRMVLAEYLSRFDDGSGVQNLIETAKNIAYFNMKEMLNL